MSIDFPERGEEWRGLDLEGDGGRLHTIVCVSYSVRTGLAHVVYEGVNAFFRPVIWHMPVHKFLGMTKGGKRRFVFERRGGER